MTIDIISGEIFNLKIQSRNNKILHIKFTDEDPITNNPSIVSDIENYFSGKKKFKSKIILSGTPFQKSVWREILSIPYGQTRTYKQIAQQINNPLAYRAVANACNKNKIAIIVPCHRVVGINNKGGYKWGLQIKTWLLDFEANNMK